MLLNDYDFLGTQEKLVLYPLMNIQLKLMKTLRSIKSI